MYLGERVFSSKVINRARRQTNKQTHMPFMSGDHLSDVSLHACFKAKGGYFEHIMP